MYVLSEYYESVNKHFDVSVCIITYNQELYIEKAVNSVLAQKGNLDVEIVICDDNSKDNTREIIKKLYNSHLNNISLVLNRTNVNISNNLFNGLIKCKGDYISILYGDDYFSDDCVLNKQLNTIKNVKCSAVSIGSNLFYDGSNRPYRYIPVKTNLIRTFTLKKFLFGFDVPSTGIMFRKDLILNNINDFEVMPKASKYIDDLSFVMILLSKGNICYINEYSYNKRVFSKKQKNDNFNVTNTKFQMCNKMIDLLNNFNKLNNYSFNLYGRYGLVLATAEWDFVKSILIKNHMSFKELVNLYDFIDNRYNRFLLFINSIKGIAIKLLNR